MKILKRILIAVAVVWAVLLVAVRIILSPSLMTGFVNDMADEFIDGDVDFGRVSTSVLKNFPNLNVTLHDFTLTYPSDRFAGVMDENVKLMHFGRGETADTLASFKEFSASVNMLSLAAGRIKVHAVTLNRPRIFAKNYGDSLANWDIFRFSGPEESQDEVEPSGIPEIIVEKVILDGRPVITYCSQPDTLFAFLNLKEMKFLGKISTVQKERPKIDFSVDSLFVSGRKGKDTLALGLERLYMDEHSDHIDLEASANTFLATRSYGRLQIPVNIMSHISFPQDTVPAVSFRETVVDIAGIPMRAEMDVRYLQNSIYLKGTAGIDNCRVEDVLHGVGKAFVKGADKMKTDARLVADAGFDGYYDLDGGGRIPHFNATVSIPESSVSSRALRLNSRIALNASAETLADGRVDVSLDKLLFHGPALDLNASGMAGDLLGEDPLFDVKTSLTASLDTLGRMVGKQLGYDMAGELAVKLGGRIRLSQIDPYKIIGSDLRGFVKSTNLDITSVKDSVRIYADSMKVMLGLVENRYDNNAAKGEKILSLAVSVDSTHVDFKDALEMRGKKISLFAYNSAEILNTADSAGFYPFGGRLNIGYFSLKDSDDMSISLRKSENTFDISADERNPETPLLKLASTNGGVFLRDHDGRIFVRDFKMDADARRAMPREHRRRPAGTKRMTTVPDWLSEDDFRKSDISFSIDESIAKYLREWDASGRMNVGRISVVTPRFPLKTALYDFHGTVTNNEVVIDSFKMKSGSSGLSATGKLSGLKWVLQGRGGLKLDMDVIADSLNVTELLAAAAKGASYIPPAAGDTSSVALDDAAFEEKIMTDTLAQTASSLLVVPANLMADISLNASNVSWSGLHLDRATADIKMMQRCIQITNTNASSNVGDLSFEGFYSTKTKKDLKTGFRLTMNDITADEVISLIPEVDTIMPILKTFRGNLDCEIAATADIDTSMNIVMPTLNGIIRVGGRNLEIADNPAVNKLARLLKFNDSSRLKVDRMSVEGMIKDNVVEIFPFIMNVDRYMLGMSGIQRFDQSFKYHVSIIRSPLLIRFGVDMYGNFDDFKFKVGKAKYKNENVPVFSAAIDKTSLSLSNSIRNIFRKGVDEAVNESRRQEEIEKYKERTNYVNAAEVQLDSLSAEEKQKINE